MCAEKCSVTPASGGLRLLGRGRKDLTLPSLHVQLRMLAKGVSHISLSLSLSLTHTHTHTRVDTQAHTNTHTDTHIHTQTPLAAFETLPHDYLLIY
jgi:hypothetical protein